MKFYLNVIPAASPYTVRLRDESDLHGYMELAQVGQKDPRKAFACFKRMLGVKRPRRPRRSLVDVDCVGKRADLADAIYAADKKGNL